LKLYYRVTSNGSRAVSVSAGSPHTIASTVVLIFF